MAGVVLIYDSEAKALVPQYVNAAGTAGELWKGADGHGSVRSSDGKLVTVGAMADAAATDYTSVASLVSLFKAQLREMAVIQDQLDDIIELLGSTTPTEEGS